MNVERRTPQIEHPMRLFHYESIRCSMFLSSLFLLATPRVFGQSNTNALPQLLPPYGQMPPTFWEQHEAVVVAGGFVLLALAAFIVWRILNPRPQPVLPPAIAARAALAKCRARPEDKEVLGEVSQALRRYAGTVFEFPSGEYTTAEFCAELERGAKLTPELTRDVSDFLRSCDELKFSPAVSSAPLDAADRALKLIVAIELRDCPRKDVRTT